jgi:xylulokinase
MHGLVVLNDGGEVLRPAILWNDQRSFAQCEAIYEAAGGRDGLLSHTNNAMLPGYTGSKILWVRDNEPDIYRQIARFLLPKDYLRYRLTGEYATDVSDASGTGLFDVRERRWALDLIDELGIPHGWFPESHESSDIVGSVTHQIATGLGLQAGTPVIAGGGDAVMQTVGGGAIRSDTALVVTGTAGNVTVSVPRAIENPGGSLQVFCHVIPEQWAAMGVTLTAGSSLKWYRDTLGGPEVALGQEQGRDPYDILGKEASNSPPGSHGLIFLPYLQGERSPHVDVNARGAFLGLGLHTRKSDLIRSIMEGVTFSLRDVLALIEAAGFHPSVINSSGGGSSSPVWRQIQADVFNRDVTTLDYSEDAGAIGAGIVAGVQMGFWPAVDNAVSLIQARTVDRPNPVHAATYDRLFRVYQGLYPALKPTFDELARQPL